MPRYRYDQSLERASGAAVVMTALAELGLLPPTAMNLVTEARIYEEIWMGSSEALPMARLSRYFVDRLARSSVIENNESVNWLAGARPDYRLAIERMRRDEASWRSRPLRRRDLAEGARLIAPCLRRDRLAFLYLLAREDQGRIYVMCPNGGVDEPDDRFFEFLNGNGYREFGSLDYIAAGVCAQVVAPLGAIEAEDSP